MYATVMDYTFKAGKQDEGLAIFEKSLEELKGRVEGLRGYIVLDHGDNKGTGIAMYESKEAWQAATPVAKELLASWAPLFVEMPERGGCEVPLAKRYAID